MTIDKLKAQEPLFGSWYIDTKLAEGKNSQFFKVYKTNELQKDFLGLKVLKFPSSEKEISDVISSEKYTNINEYLDEFEKNVKDGMNKMLSLRTNKNIVRYDNFTIIREQSCFYVIILMELLTPLSDYIKFDSIDVSQVVFLGRDICSAIQGFRHLGVIHHGIKPENIYVDNEGNYKLADFGFTLSESPEKSAYAAPELFRETGEADTASDVYALGILLYKLLNNNRTPFLPAYPAPISLSDREEAFRKTMQGDTFAKPANSDSELWRIISKATEFSAYKRYFSPALMQAELDRYLDTAPQTEFTPLESVSIPLSGQPKFDIAADNDIHFEDFEGTDITYMSETETTEETPETGKSKAVYFLVLALAIVLCVIIALIFGSNKETPTTEPLPTVDTTAPLATVPTTLPTTLPTTTTEVTTTEETTTEMTTTEPSTTEATTTEPETTEATTTEPETTEPPSTEPTLVATNKQNGDIASDGRTYVQFSNYALVQTPEDIVFGEIAITVDDDLGQNPIATGNTYIYQMIGGTLLSKIPANVTLVPDDENYEGKMTFYISVDDGDFYYEPENYQYYLCLEEGAIESDDKISLPLQIKI